MAMAMSAVPHGALLVTRCFFPAGTPRSRGNRVFSLTYQKIEWVRTTVPGLMKEEGILTLASLRLPHACMDCDQSLPRW